MTEYIAILQRKWGFQIEFIIAFDDLTREGYRLMAVDEGKAGGDSSGGFTAGVNAYFYFQNMKYVKQIYSHNISFQSNVYLSGDISSCYKTIVTQLTLDVRFNNSPPHLTSAILGIS